MSQQNNRHIFHILSRNISTAFYHSHLPPSLRPPLSSAAQVEMAAVC